MTNHTYNYNNIHDDNRCNRSDILPTMRIIIITERIALKKLSEVTSQFNVA